MIIRPKTLTAIVLLIAARPSMSHPDRNPLHAAFDSLRRRSSACFVQINEQTSHPRAVCCATAGETVSAFSYTIACTSPGESFGPHTNSTYDFIDVILAYDLHAVHRPGFPDLEMMRFTWWSTAT